MSNKNTDTDRLVTVMSYNIQIGIGSAHNPTWDAELINLDRIVAMIQSHNPHIVALQEVDRFMRRSRFEDQVALIAESLDMHYAYGPAYYRPETEHGRGMYGNALLSKFPIVSSVAHALPGRNELREGEAGWVIEPRCMLEAKLAVNDGHIYAYSAHLSTTPDQQAWQTARIMDVLSHVPGPHVVMGDFNAEPDSPAMLPVLTNLHYALDDVRPRATYPNGLEAAIAIDYVLTSPDVAVTKAYVVDDRDGVSDHNPVVASLRLPE